MMIAGDLFDPDTPNRARDWPDFRPVPATTQIVQATTAIDRLALFAQVPKGWQEMVLHFVVIGLAARAYECPPECLDDFRATVPEAWRDQVRMHLPRFVAAARARRELERARKS